MVNKEIAADIIHYGQGLAECGPATLTTGFLTRQHRNKIDSEEAKSFAMQSEYIVRELVKQLAASDVTPDDYQCRVLFQYIFDKVAEATYKTIVGKKVDTELNLNEAFEYHEPDLPYYIQQKITNAVPRIVGVSSEVLRHINNKGYRTDDLENWFLPFLILPGGLAMQFVLEMDLDDDSELRHYIGED